ncbi:MAG: excinuclease ABC subunit UvrC, partial [Shinella sp.]
DLDFERAAVYRDRLAALSHVQSHQGINPAGVEEADIFAIHHEGGVSCIQVFFFRTGQNWGNRAYFPKADPQLTGAEVLNAFLAQFYDDKPCPRQILLSETIEEMDLLAQALSERSNYKVTISVPQRGEKKDLVDHVVANAREAHGRKLAETASQSRLLEGFAATFKLPTVPRRVEIYDNSHIMGTNAVGGMVVAGPEGFVKGQYRKFNIKSTDITPGDDFGMMKEVMTRRFARLIKEEGLPDRSAADTGAEAADLPFPAWPDVILIDGGQGQMTAVRAILEELGITDQVVAIGVAKGADREAGRERFFMRGTPDFSLPPRDPVLYFVQRLRDEAHRFAIGSHRARRKKEMVKNPLDEIAGIGPTRKRALLQHFGTAKAVSRAAMTDMMAVEGISETVARLVYNHFHDDAAG